MRLTSKIAALALLLLATPALAVEAPKPEGTPPDAALLAAPPKSGQASLGKADAPVTVIEYASLTCPHCSEFYRTTLKPLKETFIDTGKVHFIYRPFPLNVVDLGAYTLAECRGEEYFMPMVDLLFSQQDNWAYVDKPLEALLNTVKQAGFTQESATACLKNSAISDALKADGDYAETKLDVKGTPTFFINGQRYVGALSFDQMSAIITPLIKN